MVSQSLVVKPGAWHAFKHSRVGALLKRVARPVLPGWVDEGRIIVQGPYLRKMLERVIADSRPANVLNAGAGEGLYSSLLLGLPSKQVLELDVSYTQNFRKLADSRQRLLAASLTAIPLGDVSVDLILCSEVLEHIVEDELALDELTRVLSPSGWLLISVPTPPAVFDPAHVREGYRLRELADLLAKRGLEIVKAQFCMHAFFRFFLTRYRAGFVPRFLAYLLSWLDYRIPVGRPMDVMVLARKGGAGKSAVKQPRP
jgi:SAM-dependent methyltransferase